MNWFRWFPHVEYEGRRSIDITSGIKVAKEVISRFRAFYPYTVRDGELPWHIANWYYGGVEYTWMVLLSNDIVDPTGEWYMDEKTFRIYMNNKYKNVEENGLSGVSYAENHIVGYKEEKTYDNNNISIKRIVSPDTNVSLRWDRANIDRGNGPIYLYDTESEKNQARKNIVLLEDIHAAQAQKELRRLLQS